MVLQILVGAIFVFAISFPIFRMIKKGKMPNNSYTPIDDIDAGRKRD
ncbi:hypothetical protein ACFFJQ_11610 [Bacillus capparidis]|uniref:DUF3951 domain-containing protein n=1 Tax=Bacillus capparidis TaxID=1840411 RepID=A0ABS4CSX2_9BACI|nr:hypothetical protein [Bacillus capparidis]MBP1080234.1 hypothetical protein [Bacillus capparidis]